MCTDLIENKHDNNPSSDFVRRDEKLVITDSFKSIRAVFSVQYFARFTSWGPISRAHQAKVWYDLVHDCSHTKWLQTDVGFLQNIQ